MVAGNQGRDKFALEFPEQYLFRVYSNLYPRFSYFFVSLLCQLGIPVCKYAIAIQGEEIGKVRGVEKGFVVPKCKSIP